MDWRMIVNHDRRFIFFHVPKTAGSSVRAAIARLPGSQDITKPTKHLMPAEIDRVLQPGEVARSRLYFSFCFVRDPWERFGSLHRFLVLRHREKYDVPVDLNDFASALAEQRCRLQPRHSTRPQVDFASGVSFIGRFERMEEDVAHVGQLIGAPHLRLKHKNSSGDQVCYRDRMTARSEAIIAAFYKQDIERFGYR